jgi:hypothetical protein
VQLSKDAVSGVARFADPDYIAAYDAWVDRENTRARRARCRRLRRHQAVSGFVGAPPLVAVPASKTHRNIRSRRSEASGRARAGERRRRALAQGLVRLSPDEQFWIRWNSADAATMKIARSRRPEECWRRPA